MNFSEVFIRRPVATSLLMVGIALFGVMAYLSLPVSDLPNVDFPTITVSASLPGAAPATMASAVATPLERQFSMIAGIDSMTSTNSMGSTQVALQFDLGRSIDGAAVDVQTAIAGAMPLLPPGMPSPPSFRKVNPADSPIMFLSLTSEELPLYELDEYAERMIAQRLSMINGVAQVTVFGAQKYSVHIKVDPARLAAMKLGINQVAQALRDWNVNMPTGTLWGPHQAYNVQANGQLMSAADYKPMVIAWRNGAPVRLGEVAQVVDTVEDERTISWLYTQDGPHKGVNMIVLRQPDSNVIEVNDEINRVLPSLQAQLPPSVRLGVRGDRSKNIREAFSDIQFTMLLTMVLVIGVIFLFLRSARATLIPSLALPFSIVGTFAVMYVLGFSMNNLSMMALILAVGFVVDDAIVMLENIMRHIENGEAPMVAALRGSREIWFTIVSMTISLAAVFIPILFMGGILGRLFREFAVTICTAILISGFVSISLTPMLCSKILRHASAAPGIFYRVTERSFDAMLGLYSWTLRWVLRHQFVMVLVFFGVIGATVYFYGLVPKGFIPEVDNDQLYINTEMAQGTGFETMQRYQQIVANVLRSDPDITTFMSSVGGNLFGSSGNTGRMFVQLKPRRERKRTALDVANSLRPKLARIIGVKAFVTLPQSIRLGNRPSKSTYEFTLQGPETRDLYAQAAKLEREMAKLPAILDISSDLQMRSPRVRIDIDRDKAGSLGVNVQEIESALYNGYGPSWTSTIYSPLNQYRVLLEVLPEYQKYSDMLNQLYLSTTDGRLIPLDSVTNLVEDVGPQTIAHSGQLPSVTISFNLRPGVALGEAVSDINEIAQEVLPDNITTNFTGTAKAFQDSLRNLTLLLVIAIAVVYIVLGVLYESFIHPVTILSGLPAAGFGALLTLYLFGMELSIYSFVGLILLVGIVKKNAIMQIDFALECERREGKSPRDAIYEGCITRFRPIMMTTMAALFGALPMAVGYGAGSEARRPLGTGVVGGLIFSQLVTLYLTPVVYIFMARWFAPKAKRKPEPAIETIPHKVETLAGA